jgi:hypothetical protein
MSGASAAAPRPAPLRPAVPRPCLRGAAALRWPRPAMGGSQRGYTRRDKGQHARLYMRAVLLSAGSQLFGLPKALYLL